MTTITTINPATEKAIHSYDIMTEKQATARLESCHGHFCNGVNYPIWNGPPILITSVKNYVTMPMNWPP